MSVSSLVLILGAGVAVVAVAIAIGADTALVLALLALLALALLVAYLVLAPMKRVKSATETIARGDFTARVRPRPSGPAGELADSFNRMAERLQQQMDEAAQERNRLAAALNSNIDAVAALDRNGRILFANVAFERAFGIRHEDLAGRPFAWVLADEQILEAIKASREQGLRQTSNVERTGRQQLQVVTTPIVDGGEWSTLVVCHDLTEVRRLEQMRRDFVANVSHELRTPLAAIKSLVETLADGALQDESVAGEFLRRADQEVDRLVLLVEELLELSRIESGEQPLARQATDVALLLGEIVERLRSQAERADVDLRLDVAPDTGSVEVDPARLERAVLNLVHNAIKFTPAGGSVTVRTCREDGALAVDVADTGIGIAAADVPRVFERFYKVDQSRAGMGTGLGLALVKHAVEAHGGSVTLRSEPGRGSVFSLRIPVVGSQ